MNMKFINYFELYISIIKKKRNYIINGELCHVFQLITSIRLTKIKRSFNKYV